MQDNHVPQPEGAILSEDRDDRPVYTYTIPKSIKATKLDGYGLVKTVGLVELDPEDELGASRVSGTDQVRLAFELAKRSLVRINGKSVGFADSSIDRVWKQMGSAIRTLVITAYGRLHSPPEGAATDFLGSVQVSVGK